MRPTCMPVLSQETTTLVKAKLWQVLLLWALLVWPPVQARPDPQPAPAENNVQILEAFTQAEAERNQQKISDQRKHQILFMMGIALLVLLIATLALGVAMAVYGKQMFVAHMLFAGLSVTLALAHAVAAVVWFYPF